MHTTDLDKKTDATIAKLAAKVADYYDAAHYQAVSSSVFPQQWIIHVHVKNLHFNAAAQYRKGCEALSAGKYGEEIARLHLAESHVKKAMEYHKQLGAAVLNDLKGLQAVLASHLARAEKDNNIIYLEIVPKVENLSAIGRAEMVTPTPVPDLVGLGDVVGAPLFSKVFNSPGRYVFLAFVNYKHESKFSWFHLLYIKLYPYILAKRKNWSVFK